MSRITIGSNTTSLNAQRRLSDASSRISKTYERLSSGLRINRASDDAASLAIVSDLNAQSRVYSQALRNVNDGISLLNIADSTVQNLSDITARLQELASQAANGSYSVKQRAALDSEAQALSKEFTRIAQSTEFNDMQLLNGSIGSGLRLQLGYGTDGGINSGIGGAIGTGTFTLAQTVAISGGFPNDLDTGDVNNDGIADVIASSGAGVISVTLGTGDGTFGTATTMQFAVGAFTSTVKLGDVNGDGKLDIIGSDSNASNRIMRIAIGNGDGTFGAAVSYVMAASGTVMDTMSLGDIDADGDLDVVASLSGNLTAVMQNTGNGTFVAAGTYLSPNGQTVSDSMTLSDINNDSFLDMVVVGGANLTVRLGSGTGTFGSAITTTMSGGLSGYSVSAGDFNNDGKADVVVSGVAGGNTYNSIFSGNGNGTFVESSSIQIATGSSASRGIKLHDVNGDGNLDIMTPRYGATSVIGVQLGRGDGTFAAATSFADVTNSSAFVMDDFNGDGVLDFAIGGSGTSFMSYLGVSQHGTGALLDFSLKSISSAKRAISILAQKSTQLSLQRGQIGAFQSRLSSALKSVDNLREQYSIASSRIADADIADESSQLIKNQILQQVGTAVLAQANQSPSIALKLLQTPQ